MTTPPQRDSRGRFLPRPLTPPDPVPVLEAHDAFPELDDASLPQRDPPHHGAWAIGGVVVVAAILACWMFVR